MPPRGSKPRNLHDEEKIIRVECNMEEFPYFRLSKRDARTLREIYYSRDTRNPEGDILLQEWIVRASGTLGLPGPFDQDVYVALEEIIDERGIDADGSLPFTKYRIAEIMGKGHSGIIYQKITQAIERMIATSITSGQALYHKGERHHVSGVFALYDEVSFYNRAVDKSPRRNIEYNILYPSRWYTESRRANYVKPLNSTFYRSLALPTSKKLYRLLDKRSYPDRSRIELSLSELARALPLTDEYPSFLKKVLDKAHAELVAGGFLTTAQYEPMRRGEWKVAYSFPRRRDEEPIANQLARMLVHRGISRPAAIELARRFPHRIARQVEVFDWLMSAEGSRIKTNPAGFLRKSIEDDYAPAPGFISDAEKKAVREESLRKIREKQQEMEHQERQRIVLLEKIREVRETLPSDTLARLETQAEANLNTFMRRKLRDERKEGRLKPTTKIAMEEELNRLIEMKYLNQEHKG